MRHGADGGCAGDSDRVGAVDRVGGSYQKIWVPFPCHIHLGPSRRPIWRSPIYIWDPGFFSNCAVDCGPVGHRNGSVSDRACSALNSQAPCFVDLSFVCDPLVCGSIYGPCMLAGGIIIAVMILPIIVSVSREILRSVPDLQREAAYGLGATRWEATRIAVLSYAKKGLFGAVILGLGRALGETMAVTMVIGNTPQIAASLFKPGYTLASVLANEFTEATTDVYLEALFEIGLVLFGITILVNLLAQLLLRTIATTSATRAVQ